MSYTETRRRWQALQEIEALASAGCEELPWNQDYAEIFGDADALVAALRYRWNLACDTQLDSHLSEAVLDEQRARLEARNAGVLRLLRQHAVPAAPRRERLTLAPPPVPSDRISA